MVDLSHMGVSKNSITSKPNGHAAPGTMRDQRELKTFLLTQDMMGKNTDIERTFQAMKESGMIFDESGRYPRLVGYVTREYLPNGDVRFIQEPNGR